MCSSAEGERRRRFSGHPTSDRSSCAGVTRIWWCERRSGVAGFDDACRSSGVSWSRGAWYGRREASVSWA
eukprot:15165359-Alexandrium_andersonii.AAC.1